MTLADVIRHGGPLYVASAIASASVPIFAAPLGQPALAAPPSATKDVIDDSQVASLVSRIFAALDAMPPQARAPDIEARLAFAVDQTQTRCSIAQRAVQLAMLKNSLSRSARAALRSVSISVSRCDISGTAALPAAQQILAQGTSLSLGGGSSNYVTQ